MDIDLMKPYSLNSNVPKVKVENFQMYLIYSFTNELVKSTLSDNQFM